MVIKIGYPNAGGGGAGGAGGGQNLPAIFGELTNALVDLTDAITKHNRPFNQYSRRFIEYNKAFTNWTKRIGWSGGGNRGGGGPPLLPWSGGGAGGGGGSGGGGGGGPGNPPKPPPKNRFLEAAFFGAALNKLMQTIMDSSEVQQRALASNTNISKLNIFSSNVMGMNLKTLAMEILSLKEEGVNNLNNSTLALIGRMKLTGQSTEGLIKLLGVNSVSLNLNNKQAQSLVSTLEQFSLNYGVRQDRLLDFASAMTKQLELPSLMGFGKNLTESISLLAAKTGGKGEEAVQKAVQFITNPENYSKLVALGINQYADKWLTANAQEGALLMQKMADTASETIKRRVGNISGPASLTRATAAMTPYGPEAAVFMQMSNALKEGNQLVTENQNNLKTLATLGEQLMIPLQYLGGAITSLITLLGPFAEFVARVAGVLVAAVAINAAYKSVGLLMGFARTALPFLFNPATLVPLLITGLVVGIGSYLFDAFTENTKEVKKLNESKDKDNLTKPISNFMLQIGENIRQLGMTRSGHDQQVAEYLKAIATHTQSTANGIDPGRGLPSTPMVGRITP